MKNFYHFRRVLAMILVALTLLGSSACKNSQSQDGETTGNQLAEPAGYRLIDNGSAAYRIIYPSQSNVCLTDALDLFQHKANQTHKVKFSTSVDMLASVGNTDMPEILLGKTSFEESATAMSALPANAFSITVSNGRIVIVASNDALYATAVEQLLSACTETEKSLILPLDYSYTSQSYDVRSIVSAHASEYVIVYEDASSEAKTLAQDLKGAIFSATGVSLSMMSDSKSEAKNFEILIGNTNRNLFSKNTCSFVEYGILWDDTTSSIALMGTVDNAVARLVNLIGALGSEGELSLVVPIFGVFQPNGYGRLPAYREDCDLFVESDPDQYSYYALYNGSDPEEYATYLNRLETQEGFTRYAYREVNGNLFATYTDGETILTVNYIKYSLTTRIMVESTEYSALPSLANEVGTPVTTPQLTQFSGACAFLMRLSDGRFIVMDGGSDLEENWKGIYDQLCAQNVLDGKPVIAAWILSHGHSDHFGGFAGFSERYSSKVTLENVVVNLPSYDVYSQNTEEAGTTEYMQKTIQSFKDAMKKYPKTQIIVPHAGWQMYFGDALIDILYTQEDLSPNVMKVTNSSCLLYTVTIAGQKITILNDGHDDSCYILYRMYGNTLKTDIVQIAHHGLNGGNSNMYEKMAADITLWTHPVSIIVERALWDYPRNNFDFSSAREHLMMESGTMVIPLPHAIGSLPSYAYTLERLQLLQNSQ